MAPSAGSVLLPHIDLTIGKDRFSTTVPPDHVEEMRFTSRMTGPAGSRLEVILLDPTHVQLERALLSLDPKRGVAKEPIVMRWGFPEGPGVPKAVWSAERKFMLLKFTPEYTPSGTRITLEAAPWIEEQPQLAPATQASYRGTISTVVRQIAKSMGFRDEQIFVEDTVNFRHALWGVAYGVLNSVGMAGVLPDERDLGDQEWALGTAYPLDYINERMLPLARSADSGKPFESARIEAGRSGPEFHFHPAREAGIVMRLSTWFGKTDDVVNFTPQYNSSILGSIGSRGVVASAFDPSTKQHVEMRAGPDGTKSVSTLQVLSAQADAALAAVRGLFAGTPASPAPPAEAADDITGGPAAAAMVTQDNLERAQAEVESIWAGLYYSIQQATLVLVGTPDNMLLIAEDLLAIDALLPDGSSHWSDGRYRISEVCHVIGLGGYHLNCNLYRDFDEAVTPQVGGIVAAQ